MSIVLCVTFAVVLFINRKRRDEMPTSVPADGEKEPEPNAEQEKQNEPMPNEQQEISVNTENPEETKP